MSQVINTNIMSLTAQNNLNKSQSSLAQAMQRLSSGLRINSSADDAAGFAIAGRMTTQINGLDQASRNANDAVSLAQTASAALQQITSNLQSIRQLAVQSANATNSQSDRDALDAAVQQSLDEITRVSQQTTFNGQYILRGGGNMSNLAFQVGANVGETISINLKQGTQANQLGAVATASHNVTGAFTSGGTPTAGSVTSSDLTTALATGITLATGALKINGNDVTVSNVTDGGAFATAITTAINVAGVTAAFDNGKITITNTTGNAIVIDEDTNGYFGSESSIPAQATSGATSGLTLDGSAGKDLKINGTSITGTFADTRALSDAINAAGITGVTSYVNGDNLVLQTNGTASDGVADDGDSILVSGTSAVATAFGGTATGGTAVKASDNKDTNTLATSNDDGVNVKSVAAANDAINRIDAALAQVSGIDSQLGAMQNRFNSAIANAQAVSQNLSASRSRIQDADFAAETAAMSQSQILQQAGISMLAQANAAPQLVLKLLQ